jgi:glycosyltransferase involved in cell wall biosynthesis
VFIEQAGKIRSGAKVVQRLDGIWFKPEQFVTHNVGIKRLYDTADHVIWQSEFDKNMTVHHWGERRGSIIRNGIDLTRRQPFDRSHPFDVPTFVSSASWHPQKRLISNVKLFDHIKSSISGYERSKLLVMGDVFERDFAPVRSYFGSARCPDLHESVFFLGKVDHETCLKIYASAAWMLHLAWLDHCPNVVVEALSQGCPVICTSAGGTKELVRTRGLVLDDEEYRCQLLDYDSPPELDFSNVRELPDMRDKFDVSDLDIERVADDYVKVLF